MGGGGSCELLGTFLYLRLGRLSLGRAAGARCPFSVGAGVAGVGTYHKPHSARSCELVLRAVGAAQGRPGGGRLVPG